jgi:hypothetical protein
MPKLDISSPKSVKHVGAYMAVNGAAAELPKVTAWEAQVGVFKATHAPIRTLCEYLRAYHDRSGTDVSSGWDRLALMGQLFFVTDHWLKMASKSPDVGVYKLTTPPVTSLFLTVVDKLCKAFQCSPNVLPQALEEWWGRALTEHGYTVDNALWQQQGHTWVPRPRKPEEVGKFPDVAQYLSRAEVENYRLRFDNGLAYMRSRSDPGRWVLAHSESIGWSCGDKTLPAMMDKGYAGFALSMGRELFMAHHRGSFDKDNFFHSSYLSGESVLCTGTIKIVNGRVKAIRNDSGHYQPTVDHLLNVLQTLAMHGVKPADVTVRAVPYSWKDKGVVQTTELRRQGDELLRARNNGGGLYARMEANAQNIAHRQGGKLITRVRTLPPPAVAT